MTAKQNLNSLQAPDGSYYVTLTDGAGNLNTTAGTQIQGNASGTTGAVTGTLAAVAGKTTYIAGFNVSSAGSGLVGPVVVAGLLGGSQTYQLTAPGIFQQTYSPPLPASATNTAITITTTADATATAVNVNSWGYQQ